MPKVTEEGLKKIEEKIETIFTTEMEVDDFEGDNVPSVDDLPDKNKGLVVTNCTILFVDIRSSTKLSDKSQAKSMAKIYRAFARAMSMCVYESGGRVRQIAGDRVMGVFVDDAEESSVQKAMDAARAILSVVEYVFNPLCRRNVNQKEIACGVGIDTGRILVTPIGIKHKGDDSRDLVWAGKTANVASKHTDLAEASEIFVTKRFYEKLPSEYKKDSEGSEIWTKTFRLKGDTLFEGYGVHRYYEESFLENTAEEEESQSVFERHETIDGVATGQIVSGIVNSVQSQVGDLLDKFEAVIHRERNVSLKEKEIQQKKEELDSRESKLKYQEANLKEKEKQMDSVVEHRKKQAVFEVKVIALRERMNSMSINDFLVELKNIKTLGAEIGKSDAICEQDLFVWKLVSYLRTNKEVGLAYKVISNQLRYKTSYTVLPNQSDVIAVVKMLGKEQEYLSDVLYHVTEFNPNTKIVLELRDTLKKLGMTTQIGRHPQLFLE